MIFNTMSDTEICAFIIKECDSCSCILQCSKNLNKGASFYGLGFISLMQEI